MSPPHDAPAVIGQPPSRKSPVVRTQERDEPRTSRSHKTRLRRGGLLAAPGTVVFVLAMLPATGRFITGASFSNDIFPAADRSRNH
jgi:hypothetical protein